MITLSSEELALQAKLSELKKASGSHSPSVQTLRDNGIAIKIDACFLSNPYATDLVMAKLQSDVFSDREQLRALLEFYPSQNSHIAGLLENKLSLPAGSIFIGNGASEAIQAIMHTYTKTKAVITLPTFSPYYEFILPAGHCEFFTLKAEDNFYFDPEKYLALVAKVKPDTVVIINPNNPTGTYIPRQTMLDLLTQLKDVPTVIVDESFIDFAYESPEFESVSIASHVSEFPNLVIIKSMSKDFGIAGMRLGYAVAAPKRIKKLLEHGYLWNSNGLGEYFLRLYAQDQDFETEYQKVRKQYISQMQEFQKGLATIKNMRIYPTKANFILAELPSDISSETLIPTLLHRYGIYIRPCTDKKGLIGNYLRIAGRTAEENAVIIKALKTLLG